MKTLIIYVKDFFVKLEFIYHKFMFYYTVVYSISKYQ